MSYSLANFTGTEKGESVLRDLVLRYRCALALCGILLVTAPLGVASRPLAVGAEAREAAIAKGMAESGNFLSTRLAGGTLYEKPPFFYAAVAGSIRLAGAVTPVSARLPSVLLAAVTLLSAAWTARLLFSPRAAVIAMVVLSTTYLFAVNAHDCVIDVSLAAFLSLALLAFVHESRKEGRPRWGPLFGLAVAGGLLAKGFVGAVLPVLITVPLWWTSPLKSRVWRSVALEAVLFPALAVLVWMEIVYTNGGPRALVEVLWNQQLGRFLGFSRREYSHHAKPVYFYLFSMPGMLFPWILGAPAVVRYAWRLEPSPASRRAVRGLLLGLAFAILFLSTAATKRTVYFLPAVPLFAVALAGYLDAENRERRCRPGPTLWAIFITASLSAIAASLAPALADHLLSMPEFVTVAAVALPCAALALLFRRSAPRLLTAALAVAFGSLLLLEGFSLHRMDPDRSARQFFQKVQRRVSSRDAIYTSNLNEDVLGRACLALPPGSITQSDENRLVRALADPGAFLLAETDWAMRARRRWKIRLEPVERGYAGRRAVALYRASPAEPSAGEAPAD